MSTGGWWWLEVKSCFGLAEVSSLMFLVLFKDGTQSEFSRGRDTVIISGGTCYNAAKFR